MDENETKPQVQDGKPRKRRAAKVGRRQAIKSGVAVAGGIALGTTYVKPNVVSVGVQEAYAITPVPTTEPPLPPVFEPGQSVNVWKTISQTDWQGRLSGTVTIENQADTSGVTVTAVSDDVQYKVGGGDWTNIPVTSLAFTPALAAGYTIPGPKGTTREFQYSISVSIPQNATALRNVIIVNLQGRTKDFLARASVEKSK
ncbi:MAG: hypothetical protein ACYC1C_02900 [Chloroflexota bacterium]